jgi:hypothetical protein
MSRTTDYDSRLVDGRYVTSVPIMDDGDDVDEGNLRPVHRAPPISTNGKTLRSRLLSISNKCIVELFSKVIWKYEH